MPFGTDADALLDAPVARLGPHMVRHVLVSRSGRGADPLLRIVFAPLHGERGDILRAGFRAQVTGRLTARLTGPDAAPRAGLAVATLLGPGVMYGIARGAEVRRAAIDALIDRYAPGVQAHLTP
ncbi:TetR family transcriptional regulator [Streptomyces zinciresistens K42]|uniref:TetR family transcriptional regulator n=1 Tax=Streptomyces zinciresistens K42 TaxID=700597 RepID=G2GLQ9_9ACTN|nr:TetR family transcriptional regulator [Streptomyces zinciresistens K42]